MINNRIICWYNYACYVFLPSHLFPGHFQHAGALADPALHTTRILSPPLRPVHHAFHSYHSLNPALFLSPNMHRSLLTYGVHFSRGRYTNNIFRQIIALKRDSKQGPSTWSSADNLLSYNTIATGINHPRGLVQLCPLLIICGYTPQCSGTCLPSASWQHDPFDPLHVGTLKIV